MIWLLLYHLHYNLDERERAREGEGRGRGREGEGRGKGEVKGEGEDNVYGIYQSNGNSAARYKLSVRLKTHMFIFEDLSMLS